MGSKIPDNRIAHMHGVAEYMYAHADKYNLIPEEMYFLGLNHDIGYINGKEGHEDFGGELLHTLGISKELSDIISWHGTTPNEYKELHVCFDDEIPDALILLWEADMHIDLSGKDVGYKARLEDIGNRHGFDSKPYQTCKATIEWLLNREAVKYLTNLNGGQI